MEEQVFIVKKVFSDFFVKGPALVAVVSSKSSLFLFRRGHCIRGGGIT